MKYIITFYIFILISISVSAQEVIYKPSDVDVQAIFKGGNGELMKFIFTNFKYPQCNNFADHATVKFRINKKGYIKDIVILKTSNCEAFDKEFIRVIEKMPRWKPAQCNGKNVNMPFILPIRFCLEG
jgi:TonB family protein